MRDNMKNDKAINFNVASFPARKESLRMVIDSIYHQAKNIHVHLNNYASIPTFLKLKKIKITQSSLTGDLGDLGKFSRTLKQKGYIFTIDDDIFYPTDYAQVMIQEIERLKREAFICVHANMIQKIPVQSYYKEKIGLHFTKELLHAQKAHIPGTGTMAYHSQLIQLGHVPLQYKNMSDLWLAMIAKKKNIPVWVVARDDKWLRCIQQKGAESIYDRYHLS
ncbi:MAG: hypothetical protein KBD63_07970, partial [Bacteriovoracaceae bacterium]|nr:hypothetical protein [Bacteriovoracaceae bacterium]